MLARICTTALFVFACGCNNGAAKNQPGSAPTRQRTDDELVKSADGPDCKTFLVEVRKACMNRYQNGIEVDCHTYAIKANMAMRQKSKVTERMCAMFGKELRQQVKAAQKPATATGEKCRELAKRLDARCFSKLGDPHYDDACDGVLTATAAKLDDTVCATHMSYFKESSAAQ